MPRFLRAVDQTIRQIAKDHNTRTLAAHRRLGFRQELLIGPIEAPAQRQSLFCLHWPLA